MAQKLPAEFAERLKILLDNPEVKSNTLQLDSTLDWRFKYEIPRHTEADTRGQNNSNQRGSQFMIVKKDHLSGQPKPDDEAYTNRQGIACGICQVLAND